MRGRNLRLTRVKKQATNGNAAKGSEKQKPNRKPSREAQKNTTEGSKGSVASWEGVRATKAKKMEKMGKDYFKKVRGDSDRQSKVGGGKEEASGKVARGRKRPAVAARKLASLAKKKAH